MTALDLWEIRVIDRCNQYPDRIVHPGILSCCTRCQSDYGMSEKELEDRSPANEGGYSSHECDLCGCSVWGDRFSAHSGNSHLEICENCKDYLEFGTLPHFPE